MHERHSKIIPPSASRLIGEKGVGDCKVPSLHKKIIHNKENNIIYFGKL